jgi:protein tyrosine phosphatase (PTP) superfamily phosphohydrolase (DUF442 family)/cytochrome c556
MTHSLRSALLSVLIVASACWGKLCAQPQSPPPYRPMQLQGLDNVYAVAGRFFSGSVPQTDADFALLQKLGVKTLLSVDGAPPDVERAAKFGLRYVHIPFGYDGIPATNVVQLIRAGQTLPGPVYVHCHHGKHRGPAAVAVMCEGVAGWEPALAERWMKLAGTATNYTGLYRSAATFSAPSPEALAAVSTNFPSHVAVAPLAAIMVQIDSRWDALKAAQKQEFPAPAAPNALQLQELFHETHRTGAGTGRGERFESALKSIDTLAAELTRQLTTLDTQRTPERVTAATEAMRAVGKSCSACHRNFRD